MKNSKVKRKIRKVHRYLGVIIGVQFLFWTISGVYFSWTNLDKIHGDHFKNPEYQARAFSDLISPSDIEIQEKVHSIELRDINKIPHYWINNKSLYNAHNGNEKNGISEEEALYIVKNHIKDELEVSEIELINTSGKHHEYRNRLLPAYVISFKTNEAVKAYVSLTDGRFQTVRHRSWRWFDFLWMTHTMDYNTRDNFNTIVLRVFSFMGLITVLSGFILWFISSHSTKKLFPGNK